MLSGWIQSSLCSVSILAMTGSPPWVSHISLGCGMIFTGFWLSSNSVCVSFPPAHIKLYAIGKICFIILYHFLFNTSILISNLCFILNTEMNLRPKSLSSNNFKHHYCELTLFSVFSLIKWGSNENREEWNKSCTNAYELREDKRQCTDGVK